MKNRLLFIEPFSGGCAGAQKVSLNVLEYLNSKFDLYVIHRDCNGSYEKNFINYKKAGVLPVESLLKKIFGSGDFFGNISVRNISYFIFTVLICNIYSLLKTVKLRPSYVYTYDPRGLFLSCLLLRLFRVKVIWHLHSELPKNKVLKKILILLCSRIIVPSKAIAKSFSDTDKVCVIYNGFIFDDEIRCSVSKDQNTKKIIFLGTPFPHKGVHNLLQAITILEQKSISYDLCLNIYGAFEQCSFEYKKLLDSILGSVKKTEINFKGWTCHSRQEIANSDLLVFPSVIKQKIQLGDTLQTIRSSEALPTVLIEALSVGVPVIATNTPGVSEIITGKSNGIIIEESDPVHISNAILEVFENLCLFKPDKEKTIELFSQSRMRAQLDEIFCHRKTSI
ncbi:hypothetical protein CVS41_14200 [Aeromonas veronii]|nr:glycosyltransferase family 4 protein [Aeromonas veronii]ATY78192.1 hypothetical protein CVS41_14200 [Aeromonas veronii]